MYNINFLINRNNVSFTSLNVEVFERVIFKCNDRRMPSTYHRRTRKDYFFEKEKIQNQQSWNETVQIRTKEFRASELTTRQFFFCFDVAHSSAIFSARLWISTNFHVELRPCVCRAGEIVSALRSTINYSAFECIFFFDKFIFG